MKRWMILILTLVLCLPVLAAAESCTCPCAAPAASENAPVLSGNAALVYEAVRGCTVLPKDSQVLFATEYICKVYGQPVQLLLIHATQSEAMTSLFGNCSGIVIVDLNTKEVYDYTTLSFPEGEDVVTLQDALDLVYGCFDSYLMNGNELIMTDSEICFPLTEEELVQINAALNAYFIR